MPTLKRYKIGRKGVGKLVAFSVLDEVYVKMVTNEEKSVFVLSKHVDENKKIKAIADEDIVFEKILTNIVFEGLRKYIT